MNILINACFTVTIHLFAGSDIGNIHKDSFLLEKVGVERWCIVFRRI